MKVSNYPVGFWNYLNMAEFKEEMMKDWEDAGFSMIMSPYYSLCCEDKENLKVILKWCREKGVKIILRDPRTDITHLKERTPESNGSAKLPDDYESGVQQAIKEFENTPEVLGFFLIDEPKWDVIDAVKEASQLVKKNSSKLIPFVNLYPYWNEVIELLRYKDYNKYLQDYIESTGTGLLCYDYYSQMIERGYEDPGYFLNLKYYRDITNKMGISFWNTLLTTPHFRYRKPSYDDMRWQVNTSLAYGAKGILYFTFYTPNNEGQYETNYRQGPINWWGEKTDVYYSIRDVNRELHERWGNLFLDLNLLSTEHYPASPVNGVDSFSGKGIVKEINVVAGLDPNIIISEFEETRSRQKYIFIVNANPRDSVQLNISMTQASKITKYSAHGKACPVYNEVNYKDVFEMKFWLAPGQGELFAVG